LIQIKMKKLFSALLMFALAGVVCAEGTRMWKQASYEDFERGTTRGVAIASTGRLELAPAFKAVYTSPSTFIWSITSDKDGVVYAATGAPARVYRIMPDGKATVIFEPKELQVQAVALGKDGAVYAATSPDGKVYKVTRSSKAAAGGAPEFSADAFFDPKTKYIWGLAFDADGRLYVATGDNGEIYRVDQSGKGSVFFKSDEAHIRVLAFDPKGNLIAGSDGSGLVYRISPAGQGFVLYSAPRKEITALAVDAKGTVYAAGTGEKRATPPSGPLTPPPTPLPLPGAPPAGAPMVGTVNLGGTDVYIISADGAPRKLWSSREDVVYALDFDSAGRLIAGTGNKGRIYAIEKNGDFADLMKASASQVTAFSRAPGGLYSSSSNLGKVFLMSNSLESEGSFESDVYDAKNFSRWGRAEVRGRGTFDLFARSGNVDNPDRNWSPWARLDLSKDSRLEVPPARFIQWRAVLKPAEPSTQVDEVGINYLPKNVAPVIDEIAVQVGARFQTQSRPSTPESLIVNLGTPQTQAQSTPARVEPPLPATKDRAYIGVRWAAHDDNDDNLVYSLYYRGENEREWKLLKSGLTDKFYSFDSGLLPDGGYIVKVVASDAPSHTPEEALSDEKESQRFDVDNTPPRIENLAARVDGQQIHVTFHATDDASPLKRAEYSVDAGDWQFLEPVGQLSDSKAENYDFTVLLPTPPASPEEQPETKRGRGKSSATPRNEHVVVVRVYDRFDNVATAKYVVK
jgi:sugar lactone lactonase YvrE